MPSSGLFLYTFLHFKNLSLLKSFPHNLGTLTNVVSGSKFLRLMIVLQFTQLHQPNLTIAGQLLINQMIRCSEQSAFYIEHKAPVKFQFLIGSTCKILISQKLKMNVNLDDFLPYLFHLYLHFLFKNQSCYGHWLENSRK